MQRWLHKHIRLIISRDESGQALLITMAVILVLALIPTLIASTVAQRAGLTLAFQNGASASAAAQAGLADYEGHLTSNSFYPAVYNAGNNYTSNNVQSSNKAFFQWVPVPQTPNEWYSYRVVQVPASPGSSTSSGPPTYAVIVAGCAGVLASPTSPCTGGNSAHGNQIDVISRQVQLASPFFNAYFTKYELYDPYDPNYYPSSGSSQDALPSTGQVSAVADHCVALASTKPSAGTGSFPPPVETVGSSSEGYYSQNGGYGPDLAWSTTINGQSVGCRTAMWQNQTTQGPVTSMDNFFFCGSPDFQSQVSSYQENPFWVPLNNSVYWLWYYNSQSCANAPTFGGNGSIQPIPYQHLPQLTTYQQEAEVQPSGTSSAFGCYYQGSTTMVFNGNDVEVSSPNSSVGTGSGQLNPGCPLGNSNTSFATGFNGAVFVANGGGSTPSVGPPPPANNCPNSSNQPWGPPIFELGWNPPNGNGFSGCWEPQQTGSTPANSPSGWTLAWETNDPASDGDLFVQGTVAQNMTLVAQNNLYLTGSLCVPSDSTCQETNNFSTNNEGNDISPVTYSQGSLPSSGPLIGVVAGSMIKMYNPINTPSNTNLLNWSYSFPTNLSICWDFIVPYLCSSDYIYFEAQMDFSGSGINHENNLEGYPHRNIVVDGVVFDLGGGTTTQQMPLANQAGATFAGMNTPNPFCHYDVLASIAAFFGACPYGTISSYPSLGNYDVNGASVEKFAPNLSCNQVTLPIIGNSGTCATYTLLEIPYPGINLEVLWIGNGSCPSYTPQPLGPPPPSGVSWGPIDILSQWNVLYGAFAWCIYVDAYQYVLSHTVGYTANCTYNPALAHGLPPGFPSPSPVPKETSGIALGGTVVNGNTVVSYFANNSSKVSILDG